MLVIIIVAVVALVALGRALLSGAGRQDQSAQQVDTGRQDLLSLDSDRSVRMTVRGPIVADEEFHTYTITISPLSRTFTTYRGYGAEVIDQTRLENTTAAYDQFVHALDKADFVKGKPLAGDKDDVRGICATGRVYEFDLLEGGGSVRRLWTSTCGGSKGSLDAHIGQVHNLFTQQIPDSKKAIAKLRFGVKPLSLQSL